MKILCLQSLQKYGKVIVIGIIFRTEKLAIWACMLGWSAFLIRYTQNEADGV